MSPFDYWIFAQKIIEVFATEDIGRFQNISAQERDDCILV